MAALRDMTGLRSSVCHSEQATQWRVEESVFSFWGRILRLRIFDAPLRMTEKVRGCNLLQ